MKKRIVSLAMAAVLMFSMVPAALAADNNTADYNGHRYERIDQGMTWTDAKAYSESKGGYLACVTSQEENDVIFSLIANGEKSFYWLGGNDIDAEGQWEWLSGERWQYENWGSGQPDNNYYKEEDYLGMSRKNVSWAKAGQWNDFAVDGSASGLGGFVIEYDRIASDWAKTELEKAEEYGLIPDVLKNVDYTQSITRAEFAAVAVKTYENLSGTKALPAVSDPFTDCKDIEVLKAYNLGVVNGVSSTTFEPDTLLNREQAAAMLTRVFKRATMPGWTLTQDKAYPLTYTQTGTFADDGLISDYARESVYFMNANGIIQGVGGNRFAPKNTTSAEEATGYANATREQALAIAVRMVENLK